MEKVGSLTVEVDWYSRRILSYRLSNTMDDSFCTEALEKVLGKFGTPELFNTDQGAQFTSEAFTGMLEAKGIAISMDGRGRAFDKIFIERFLGTSNTNGSISIPLRASRDFVLIWRKTLISTISGEIIRCRTTKLQMRCRLWQHKSKDFLLGLNLLSQELGPLQVFTKKKFSI